MSAWSRFMFLSTAIVVADVGADVDVVDVERRDLGDAVVEQHLERAARHVAGLGVDLPGQLVAGLDPDRAGLLVDDVLGARSARRWSRTGARTSAMSPWSCHSLTMRGVTFLPASAITSPVAALTMSWVGFGAAHALGEELRRPALAFLAVGHGVVRRRPRCPPGRGRAHRAASSPAACGGGRCGRRRCPWRRTRSRATSRDRG